ncbi:MAG: hypothetical protein EA402_03255 [Planctomycetota bacterium]|nr:MAG: hypothetical protein EA402_03255 [Planctomycetota bacterium]
MKDACLNPEMVLCYSYPSKHKWWGTFFEHVKTPFGIYAESDIDYERMNAHYSYYFACGSLATAGSIMEVSYFHRAQGGLEVHSYLRRDTLLPAPALLFLRAA